MYSADFENIKEQCSLCKECPYHEERLNVVFGSGNENADILFVGDMPRGRDDVEGIPFTGKEGEILQKFFTLCDIDKNRDVFITNIIKCRPEDGEIPEESYYDACMEHLRSQVRFIKPKIIVCFGKDAARKMIGSDFNMERQHGKFIKKGKLFFLATYHPEEIKDNETKRIAFLGDFQVLREAAKKAGII